VASATAQRSVEQVRKRADGGPVPGGPQRVLQQRAPGAGLPQEQRAHSQPGHELDVFAQAGRAFGELDRLVYGFRAGRGVPAEDPGHPDGDPGQEGGPR
jgi:hypothetical protein